MKTTVSLSQFSASFPDVRVSSLSVALTAAISFFTAILLQFDIFAYICAAVALAAVYNSEKKGGEK